MAVGTGVTEIADSEEELLPSLPATISDAAVDKLSTTADQDTQAVACPHHEAAAHTANQSSDCTGVLDVNQKNLPTDTIATRFDQPELHSLHQAATDNASAFTIDIARQADEVPREVVCAAVVSRQGDRVATNRTNDTTVSPSVQQDEMSTGHAQGLALDGHRTEMELPQSGSAQSASDEGDPGGVCSVVNVSRQGSAAAAIEALATKPGCDTACEATIHSPNAVIAYYPEAAVAEQTTPDAVNTPIPTDKDVAPEALDIVSSGESTDQRESATELSAQHNASTSVLDGETQNNIKPATTSSGTAAHNDLLEANSDASIAHDRVSPSKTTDGGGLASEQHSHDLPPSLAELAKRDKTELAASHHSAVSLSEQDRLDGDPHTASARPEATGCRSKIVVHGAYGEDHRLDAHGSSVAEGGNISPVAVGILPESQSTALQAGEPTLPFPASKLSPQEITLAELRAQKAALLGSLRVQPAIQVLMEENAYNDDEPTEKEIMAAANRIVKEHIKLLHEYNELKDVGQGLMGLIADQRGLRIMEIQEEFGIDAND